jgi:Ran GTPase-activating protein (RanGAP) involved in mRNA processing and transport
MEVIVSKKIFLFYLLFVSIGSVFNSVFGMDQQEQNQQDQQEDQQQEHKVLINSLKKLEEFTSPNRVTSLYINLTEKGIGIQEIIQVCTLLTNDKFASVTTLDLDLGCNLITDEGAKFLAKNLAKLRSLTSLRLDLGINQIGSEGITNLAEGLGKLNNLTRLSLALRWHQIGAAGAKFLAECLSELSSLTSLSLNLDHNQIGSKGITNLGKCLGKLNNLTTLNLNLSDNQIGPEGAKSLAKRLSELINLTNLSLNLMMNQIENAEVISLFTNLTNFNRDMQEYADALVESITEKNKQRQILFVLEEELGKYLDQNTHIYHLILDFFLNF